MITITRATPVLAPLFAAALVGAFIHPDSVAAADASSWDNTTHSGARLIAGTAAQPGSAALSAGVEIRLAPGWKTYWRYPGDSGIPPRFDFGQSDNVESVTVAWPAPHRFSDGAGFSIGYARDVVFPLRVTPKDAKRPIKLKLKLDYAICEKLCVPAEADLELMLDGSGRGEAALKAADALVPRPTSVGADAAFAIRHVARDATASKPRVLVDVAAPDAAPIELFAEGPTSDWALPLPELVATTPEGLRRYAFELDGLPAGASAQGATIRLTAVAGSRAIEASFRLD